MNKSDLKEIKSARPTNLARLASAIIFIIIYYTHSIQLLAVFALVQISLSFFWIWLIEKKFDVYKSNPYLWYLPASIDIFFLTACVYITGISNSSVLLGYILLTCMSSIDLIRARGLFTTIGSCLFYLFILLLAKFDIIPIINIVNNSAIPITNFSAILSSLLLCIACFTANIVIYQVYFQLSETNTQLSNSFDKINLLKLQQDADYALTAMLIDPFIGNFVQSESIEIKFHLEQKKIFSYKNKNREIGGDILYADELYFRHKKYILFLNGDAMGKSMQGACGALVLGAICKSFIANAKVKHSIDSITAQEWLLNSVSEMHRIFESFDGSMLASILIGLIDEKSGSCYYINSEHPAPILYRDGKASFLTNKFEYNKLGTIGHDIKFSNVDYFELITGDVLFIGSDGKDDIILNPITETRKIMNADELLFSRIVEKTNGNLVEILSDLKALGQFSDDLSVLKIFYSG